MSRYLAKWEIEDLIMDLDTEDPDVVDRAISELLMISSPGELKDLIRGLEWGSDRIRQRIAYILGGMLDDRCIDPLLSLLDDPNTDIVLAAIDSLQYFPEERIIPKLVSVLNPQNEELSLAVIDTLGSYIKRGVIDAHLPLVEVIQDERYPIEVRRMALGNLQHLEAEDLTPILTKLKQLGDATLYSQVLFLQDGLEGDPDEKASAIEKMIQQLLQESQVIKSIQLEERLVAGGTLSARILLQKLFQDLRNSTLRVYAHRIIQRMGHKSLPALKSLFESFNQFDDINRVLEIEDLIEIVAHPKFSSMANSLMLLLQHLKDFLSSSSQMIRKVRLRNYEYFRAYIHFVLAIYGCRDAVDDLKTMIRNGQRRQSNLVLEAIINVGNKDFLLPLINQFHAYRKSKGHQALVRRAFRAIVKREKVRKDDPIFQNLSELQQQNLRLLLGR
ncbi:MAG: HEAT repeat domain-containing protein [candidate division KSB1 bacterium]|nr:HEAT repeat domain-containing protein [candidate division KSB1 bacterium]MDZ7334044.1 HEAT repeat domain-containing protein [candidate division KSB1 bacterium]MDZ7356884.1 HEAT repeat domain-containing protein [candidate division KSB1 bacterium]MDZ7399532.1 HEAT repeat domain-containing protein [candidate division KSB1 bacterium]